MEQIAFELVAPEPPSFSNFLIGPNAELVSMLQRFAIGDATETGLVLWGTVAGGKSHLLQAAVGLAGDHGVTAVYYAHPDELTPAALDAASGAGLVALDHCDHASATAQAGLFSLYNLLRERRGHLLAASRVPVSALALREDLRTRLGWGLVYEVLPLPDADKPAALVDYARQRGLALSDEVIAYLLLHGRRDMTSLLASLAALDRYSLAGKRMITVPLVRAWLQRQGVRDRGQDH